MDGSPVPPVLVAIGRKFEKGLSPQHRHADGTFLVVELVDALTHTYLWDAHLVTYVIDGVRAQPRLLKDHRHLVARPVTVSVFFCDVDLPEGTTWTDDLMAEYRAKYDEVEVLRTAGIYHTRGGLRFVQPLAKPLPVPESEVYHRRWLHQIEAAGFQVDWACKDWTRLYRLPNVRRDGRPYRSPYLNLTRMKPIQLEPIPLAELIEHTAQRSQASTARPQVVPAVVPWTTRVPPVWQPRVEKLAAAVREVPTEWHTLFLALAGAMLRMDVPYEHVPLLCRAVSIASGNDSRTADREAGARSTVERYLRGQAVTGIARLRKQWPGVAAVLNKLLGPRREAQLRAESMADVRRPAPLDPKHALAAFEDALRAAPHGVSIVAADSALGKLSAIVNVAAERASKPYASAGATGAHVPPGSRTSICMANNVKAQSMVDELRANGIPTEFIRGPLSFRDTDGSRSCKLYNVAKPLVEGGQVMQKELCEGRGRDPCPHYATCTARLGADGPEDARVVVGSHAMAGPLDMRAGKSGLFIIEEIPELLETQAITLEDLAIASNCVDIFVGAYGTALRPALMALTAWVASLAPLHGTTSAVAAVEAGADAVLPEELTFALRAVELASGTAVDCARAAPLQDKFGDAPPLMYHEIRHAIASPSYSQKIGNASRVLQAVHRTVVRPDDFVLEVLPKNDERVLHITGVKKRLVNAMCRDGVAVVLAGGSVVPQAPVIAKIIGYEPPLRTLRVADATPIARTVLRTSAASRRRWAPGGKFVLDVSLVTALNAAIDWAREDDETRRLAIVTFEVVALALQAAIAGAKEPSMTARWLGAGQHEPGLEQIIERLGPIVRTWPGREWQSEAPRELIVTSFEDLIGLAAIRDVDALVTLGDPWPSRGAPEASAAFLRDPCAHEVRGEAECQAALERAHARLEPFDRARPGRALHVGNVLPGGLGWRSGNVDVRMHTGGRPRAAHAMTVDELNQLIKQLGGVRAMARTLGCAHSMVRKYQAGQSNVPEEVAVRLRELVGDKPTPPTG